MNSKKKRVMSKLKQKQNKIHKRDRDFFIQIQGYLYA